MTLATVTNTVARRIVEYLKSNPGAGFILAFQALLLAAAFSLIENNSGLANQLAIISFYALAIGVIIQFIIAIRS